jgi:hypothetical protein
MVFWGFDRFFVQNTEGASQTISTLQSFIYVDLNYLCANNLEIL